MVEVYVLNVCFTYILFSLKDWSITDGVGLFQIAQCVYYICIQGVKLTPIMLVSNSVINVIDSGNSYHLSFFFNNQN